MSFPFVMDWKHQGSVRRRMEETGFPFDKDLRRQGSIRRGKEAVATGVRDHNEKAETPEGGGTIEVATTTVGAVAATIVATTTVGENLDKQFWKYLPLYKATLTGDWGKAKETIDKDEYAVKAWINEEGETALHVAVGTGKSICFVEKLVELMPVESLATVDSRGYTALNTAARFGNTKAAEILVKKRKDLIDIPTKFHWLPVHRAAQSAHKETLKYLLDVTEHHHLSKPFTGESGVQLLILTIASGFYDIALDLIDKYPEVAKSSFKDPAGGSRCALGEMAKKVSAFRSGNQLKSWKRLIYYYVPLKLDKCPNDRKKGDIENPRSSSEEVARNYNWAPFLLKFGISVWQKLQDMLWKVLEILVPPIYHIRQQKLTHLQAVKLVKCLCEKIGELQNRNDYLSLAKDPLLVAASLGIHEIVEEIVNSFPWAIFASNSDGLNIFDLAIKNRHENIFNLLYQMGDYKQFIIRLEDPSKNFILHLAGRRAPLDKLNLIPGAALQMQRELQWFKEVEKFVSPSYKEKQNSEGKTPSMVFTTEHQDLVVQGEKWMKARANSCTIVAALIATIAFAAAITVPGGNNKSGLPIFSKEKAFIVFAVSNAIALFTSTTSLLMFLSILTSRYAEEDFLYILPNRLIIGLIALFLSITSMISAFSAILYLLCDHKKQWILIPVAALACLPISSFVFLQFPLLVDLMFSTYGPGIFGKQSTRSFY